MNLRVPPRPLPQPFKEALDSPANGRTDWIRLVLGSPFQTDRVGAPAPTADPAIAGRHPYPRGSIRKFIFWCSLQLTNLARVAPTSPMPGFGRAWMKPLIALANNRLSGGRNRPIGRHAIRLNAHESSAPAGGSPPGRQGLSCCWATNCRPVRAGMGLSRAERWKRDLDKSGHIFAVSILKSREQESTHPGS